jgi:diacylglycerol kinase family enzyme
MTGKTIICILNSSACSHGAGQSREQIATLFAQHGAQADIVVAEDGADIPQLARDAAGNCDIVVAGGGDGTINAVASGLIGKHTPLGVLPLGTLNHFAKDLKIPLDLDSAVANIFTGQEKQVDVGEVNGQIFLNNSSLGLYPSIVRQRDKHQRLGHGKWLSFLRACLIAVRRHPPLEITLRTPDARKEVKWSPFLFVGNNRYIPTGLHLGTRERLDEGKLYFYRARGHGRISVVWLALGALFNRLSKRDLDISSTEEFQVRTRRHRIHVARDGEVTILETPLNYRILPQALSVIAPG